MNNKKAIGLFDSGIGGLSILNDLQQRFPSENFVYLADQNNYPYGTKTSLQLRQIVNDAAKHLLTYNLKAIIIACNTASAHSDHLSLDLPVYTIIEPICKETIKANKRNILLIATEATVNSGLYKKCLSEAKISLFEYPAPNFVNLVESFEYNKEISFSIVQDELKPYLDEEIEGIILGCTHFNFLRPQLNKIFPQASLIDGLNELSNSLKINKDANKGYTKLLTTGDLLNFKVQVEELNIAFNEILKVDI